MGGSNINDWVFGMNLWTEKFDQDSGASATSLDYDQKTLGVFAQGTRSLSEAWGVEAGLRIDYDSDYGEFILPRISILYTGFEDTAVRIGGGLGYKLPTPFYEDAERVQFPGLQPLHRS